MEIKVVYFDFQGVLCESWPSDTIRPHCPKMADVLQNLPFNTSDPDLFLRWNRGAENLNSVWEICKDDLDISCDDWLSSWAGNV